MRKLQDTEVIVLCLPTLIISCGSLMASLYVSISVGIMRKHGYSKMEIGDGDTYWERPFLICHHILWMSVCDVFWSLWLILNFGAPLIALLSPPNSSGSLPISKQESALCVVVGCVGNFVAVASVSWYLVIGIVLFRAISGWEHETLESQLCKHRVIGWGVPLISSVIPLVFDSYGPAIDYKNVAFECWVTDEIYHLVMYVPVSICIVFASLLLMYVLCCLKELRISVADNIIIRRLSFFTLVFILTWIFPTIHRLMELKYSSDDMGIGMLALHYYCFAFGGLGNGLVWMNSKTFRAWNRTFTKLRYQREYAEISETQKRIEIL